MSRPALYRGWLLLVLWFSCAWAWPQTASPPASAEAVAGPTPAAQAPTIRDTERRALTVTAYDLTVQLDPASAHLSALARLTVRNDGSSAMDRAALEISSSLMWESVALREGKGTTKLAFEQHPLKTDADHTGAATEVSVALPGGLGAGKSADLDVFYSGTVARSAARLESIGVPADEAERADWDRVEEGQVYLRGFGNVLWYPVSSPAVLLGEGAALAQAAGEQKLRQRTATARLRVTVAYAETPPGAIYFCGRRGAVTTVRENSEAPEGSGPGLAVAEFPSEPLGFRPPSLFVLARAPVPVGRALDVMTEVEHGETGRLQAAAEAAEPLLTDWFGVAPLRRLTLVEQARDSFADGAFVVAPAGALLDPSEMTGALTHAWFRSSQPWLDQGVARWMALLALERVNGLDAAVHQLDEQSHALALAESNATGAGTERGLLGASTDVNLHIKALAVLWMLHSIVGDEALKLALQRVRADAALDRDPDGFRVALEKTSGKPLEWFFADWVEHDRGLPDLSITNVAVRSLPGRGGLESGSLVVVDVHNEGGAVAEVPVTVRANSLTATERLRVPAHTTSAVRIVFQGTPEEVQVNDGTVPEIVSSMHVRRVVIAVQP